MTERIYTTVDVAKLCKVSLRTVIRWVDEGKLGSFRTPGGHRRVRETDLHQFMTRFKIPFVIASKSEAKKILVIDDEGSLEGMLQQVLRRSSDLYEITLSRDLLESAVRVGLLLPDLVIISSARKMQETQRFIKALERIPETRDIRILVFGFSSPGTKMQSLVSSEMLTVVGEPLSIETLRPHLLGFLFAGDSRPA